MEVKLLKQSFIILILLCSLDVFAIVEKEEMQEEFLQISPKDFVREPRPVMDNLGTQQLAEITLESIPRNFTLKRSSDWIFSLDKEMPIKNFLGRETGKEKWGGNYTITLFSSTYCCVAEDGTLTDYYIIALEGQFHPHILKPTDKEENVMRYFASSYAITAKINEDERSRGNVSISHHSPNTTMGEQTASHSTSFTANLGIKGISPSAGIGLSFTTEKAATIHDLRVFDHLVHHIPAWEFKISNLPDAAISRSNFSPGMRWVWGIKRAYGEENLYRKVNEQLNFPFEIEMVAGFKKNKDSSHEKTDRAFYEIALPVPDKSKAFAPEI